VADLFTAPTIEKMAYKISTMKTLGTPNISGISKSSVGGKGLSSPATAAAANAKNLRHRRARRAVDSSALGDGEGYQNSERGGGSRRERGASKKVPSRVGADGSVVGGGVRRNRGASVSGAATGIAAAAKGADRVSPSKREGGKGDLEDGVSTYGSVLGDDIMGIGAYTAVSDGEIDSCDDDNDDRDDAGEYSEDFSGSGGDSNSNSPQGSDASTADTTPEDPFFSWDHAPRLSNTSWGCLTIQALPILVIYPLRRIVIWFLIAIPWVLLMENGWGRLVNVFCFFFIAFFLFCLHCFFLCLFLLFKLCFWCCR
jgi:hypothetical protein